MDRKSTNKQIIAVIWFMLLAVAVPILEAILASFCVTFIRMVLIATVSLEVMYVSRGFFSNKKYPFNHQVLNQIMTHT